MGKDTRPTHEAGLPSNSIRVRIQLMPKSRSRRSGRKKSRQVKVSRKRLWTFRFAAAIGAPLLFLLALELVLRLCGYGFEPSAIVKFEQLGRTYYRENGKFGWRFFPKKIARHQEPYVLPVEKGDDSYRIFILGGSAALGTPDTAYCFGRILQVMLRETYPGVNFEVITTAMPAINSHVVREISRSCAEHEPDLFVVYMGNNEVVGPYGAGTVFGGISKSISLIRARIFVKATRVGQLLTALTESVVRKKYDPVVWRGPEMFLKEQIRQDDPQLQTVYKHFQRNLEDTIRIARDKRIPTILCTVATNLRNCPPLSSLHAANLTAEELEGWQQHTREGAADEESGDWGLAVQHYSAALAIDDAYAELHFRIGRCHESLGQYEEALRAYVRARDLDTLRFRADSRINRIIAEVAENHKDRDVSLVDAVTSFEPMSPHGIPGEELFYEHVHLKFSGNYLLAGAVYDQIGRILPDRVPRGKPSNRILPSEAECGRLLAWTAWSRYTAKGKIIRMVKNPPFTNQLNHEDRIRRMRQQHQALKGSMTNPVIEEADALYRGAIQAAPSDWWLHWNYAGFLMGPPADPPGAARQYKKVRAIVPHFPRVYVSLGMASASTGQFDDAARYFQQALKLVPHKGDVHYNLGLTYHARGRTAEAAAIYRRALKLSPELWEIWYYLGRSHEELGEDERAITTYRDGLRWAPESSELHFSLGILLAKRKRVDEAVDELRAALELSPDSVEIRNRLDELSRR